MTDIFVEELDEADCGIDGSLEQLDMCLRVQDKIVYSHLKQLGLNPKFYAMRWLTTLLAREVSSVNVWVCTYLVYGLHASLCLIPMSRAVLSTASLIKI